jgi:uncharacterized protein (DUF58 family)
MTAFLRKLLKVRYRNRFLRFTRIGTQFVLMTLAIGVAAVNTGNNLLYLVLSMMLSLIILSGILSERNLRNLVAERVLPAHPFAGKTIPYYLKAASLQRRFPSLSFLVREGGGEVQTDPVYVYSLPPGQRILLSLKVRFPRRGHYRLSGIRFETTFPFGFFRKSLTRVVPEDVVVYPELLDLPIAIRVLLTGAEDSKWTPLPGMGTGVRSLRDYLPTDDARGIHWKASARHGDLLLKEFEAEKDPRLCLFLMNHLPPSGGEEAVRRHEQAVSLAASVAYHWLMKGRSLRISTLSGEVPMGSGQAHLFSILRFLALLSAEKGPGHPNAAFRPSIAEPALLIVPDRERVPQGFSMPSAQILSPADPEVASCWEQQPERVA